MAAPPGDLMGQISDRDREIVRLRRIIDRLNDRCARQAAELAAVRAGFRKGVW